MGTWGLGSFDNDTACDWSYGLEKVADLSYVNATLDRVLALDPTTAVPAEAAECAVAAAEVVARLKGNWGEQNSYSETVDTWVRTHAVRPPASLLNKVVAALERIVAAPSEILELLSEGGDTEAWIEAVAELKRRAQE